MTTEPSKIRVRVVQSKALSGITFSSSQTTTFHRSMAAFLVSHVSLVPLTVFLAGYLLLRLQKAVGPSYKGRTSQEANGVVLPPTVRPNRC